MPSRRIGPGKAVARFPGFAHGITPSTASGFGNRRNKCPYGSGLQAGNHFAFITPASKPEQYNKQ